MIVVNVVNGWLCEFLWAGGYKENASPLIRDRNEGDPGWVGRLAESRAAGRRWVLPPRMLTWRLHNLRGICAARRSEEHTSELQSLMRISYAVFCLKKKKHNKS